MIRVLSSLILTLYLTNCAVYKQLTPEPLPSNQEQQGYTELKKGKNPFKVKEGKQLFINFPAPSDQNYYLVLKIPDKGKLTTSFTAEMGKKNLPGARIKDETHDPQNLSLYAINKGTAGYYWLIDSASSDVMLQLDYRYVPQWRYKFENKHTQYKAILNNNIVERNTYQGIGQGADMDKFIYKPAIDSITRHYASLKAVYDELLAIESIFPSSIINSQDKAYQDYLQLKRSLEDEINFQQNYLATLGFMDIELKTRGNPGQFLNYIDSFNNFFSKKGKLAVNVVKECQRLLTGRLHELVGYYDQRLSGKADIEPFEPELYRIPEFKKLNSLYDTAAVTRPQFFIVQDKFVRGFDEKSIALLAAKNIFRKVTTTISAEGPMPSNGFFDEAMKHLKDLKPSIPAPFDATFDKYMDFASAVAINKDLAMFNAELKKLFMDYRLAGEVVGEVNALKEQKDYSAMLGILKEHKQLSFLVNKYKDLDKMSVEEQSKQISESLQKYSWREAENNLTKLHRDENFLDIDKILPLKKERVLNLEDSLYIKVDNVTRYRVSKFSEEKAGVLENVDSLYNDSVFFPAHDIKFSSGNKNDLIQRKEALIVHLAKLKEFEFPAKAIDLSYKNFLRDPVKDGVLKARAVVTHGKHYKGEDKKIIRMVAECNPWEAKWIVEPTKYRRVFAIPVTTKKHSENTYLCRLNIRIPTEAKFPVYDVNIKLPKEVAEGADQKQWYEKITLNKELLKNEGRFTISAPNSGNNYECQITPVRMNADKSNVLEIYFKHNSFKAFPVSVMAQKPLIKKN